MVLDDYHGPIYSLDDEVAEEGANDKDDPVYKKESRRRVKCLNEVRDVDEGKVAKLDDSLDSRVREAGL